MNKGLFKPYGNEVNGWYINVGDGFSGGQYNNDYTLEAYGGEIKLNPIDGDFILKRNMKVWKRILSG